MEDGFNVARHEQVTGSVYVVPLQSDVAEQGSIPIHGDSAVAALPVPTRGDKHVRGQRTALNDEEICLVLWRKSPGIG